jgi:hypothetical protein
MIEEKDILKFDPAKQVEIRATIERMIASGRERDCLTLSKDGEVFYDTYAVTKAVDDGLLHE